MIKCKICQQEFSSNSDGSLTKHLLDIHNQTLEEYTIKFDYNNTPPKCKCGICNEIPKFYRGKFKKYAYGHNKQEWYRDFYIKKYGEPKCETCGKPSGFNRKLIKRYCSFHCQGINYGFSLQSTQETIRKNNEIKYGVDNILKVKKFSHVRRSKIHLKIREYLELDRLNFISEHVIDKYIVDEINIDKKIIIEINGDHVHANPKQYEATNIIRLHGQSYTAQEKWDSDKLKKDFLEKLGYIVIVIWETDDLEEKKQEIIKYFK